MTWEKQYLELIDKIGHEGDPREDRTGVGTKALFGQTLDIDLSKGFPAVTTKKLAWKAVVSELLWFIEGSGDERRLCEILHGTRDPEKKTIWSANAEADYWKPKAKYEGDLGRVYGVQWRHWRKYTSDGISEIDQLKELILKLRTNSTDRRMILSAWNVGELNEMALPPCHLLCQLFVTQDKNKPRKLSCQMYQRSIDTFLGLCFNIASYALLTHLLAQVTNCVPGRLVMSLGDTHLYNNHLEAAAEQLTREPFPPPQLLLNPEITEITDFKMEDIELLNYQCHPSITAKMAV